jgi:hypothetical protein
MKELKQKKKARKGGEKTKTEGIKLLRISE